MDPKFAGFVKMLQDSKVSFFISCIVQGVLITGFVIPEQRFFVETTRIMNDELKVTSEARIYWEEVMLELAKLPVENAALHLAGVKMYLPTGVQNLPTLRIDPLCPTWYSSLSPSTLQNHKPVVTGIKHSAPAVGFPDDQYQRAELQLHRFFFRTDECAAHCVSFISQDNLLFSLENIIAK